MEDDSTTAQAATLFTGEAWFDPIEAGIRERIRGFIEALFEEELTTALGRGRCERAVGAPRGYRNGTRERHLLGSFGPMQVSVPRARMADAEGGTQEWRSAALPRYARMTWLADSPVDPAVFAPSQPIYTARPIFVDMPDPVPFRSGSWRGDRDEVTPPTIEKKQRAPGLSGGPSGPMGGGYEAQRQDRRPRWRVRVLRPGEVRRCGVDSAARRARRYLLAARRSRTRDPRSGPRSGKAR